MGRNKIITKPEILWEHFTNYKNWVKDNPIKVHDFVGKDGDSVYREKQRPLTMEGFECWCYDNEIVEGVEQYFSNREGRYADFVGICSRIRKDIRNNQIEGGMAGIYNPSITQRLNGLVERTENKHEVSEIVVKKE